MRFAYPVDLSSQGDGGFLVRFPDVPEALTEGASRDEALDQAADALVAALGGYVEAKRDIPVPSRRRAGQPVVALPPLVAAKLALYRAMRAQGVSNVALAHKLGSSEGAVRRLIDLDHRSHIEQVTDALGELGKSLITETRRKLLFGDSRELERAIEASSDPADLKLIQQKLAQHSVKQIVDVPTELAVYHAISAAFKKAPPAPAPRKTHRAGRISPRN